MGSAVCADIAVIGLAVMGQNLILNMRDKGFTVAAFNRTVAKVDEFVCSEDVRSGPPSGSGAVIGVHSLEELAAVLKRPRRVMLLVKAGQAVDDFLNALLPHLEPGDIVIDGGNTNYQDTNRRSRELAAKGIQFVGCGVSGGEEGARHGPSMMPGGDIRAWPHIAPIFQAIAAKVPGRSGKGQDVCCDWVGNEGAGHFVKTVHNGIEYGDMQLIAEAYDLLKRGLGCTADELAAVFSDWNRGPLESFLVEITAEILAHCDEQGRRVVERIRDAAGQKGTGKWTVISALEAGMPVTLIAEAVFARCLSAMKTERLQASQKFASAVSNEKIASTDRIAMIENIRQALYASKIISYTQGFLLMRQVARETGWVDLNYGGIALMWRGGCIIRSAFLTDIEAAFARNPQLPSLLFDDFFANAIKDAESGWRKTLGFAITNAIPTPAMSSALAFFDGYRSERSPANLIQAQRDYFGAHTFEFEGAEGTPVHVNWTGRGGSVTSNVYQA